MRGILGIFFCFCCLFYGFEGYAKHYSSRQIEVYVNKTPNEAEDSVYALAKYLSKPFDEDYDKAKAIAFWIAGHIYYDDYLYNNGQTTRLIKSYKSQEPRELLKSRVGLCGDFADLFNALCKKAGVRARRVSGFAYPAGRSLTLRDKQNSAHAWNYFYDGAKKIYVDTTFMAKGTTGASGRVNNLRHRRALKEIKKDSQKHRAVNDFDTFYFDFDYKDEIQKRHYRHKEK